ncbi:hypothetical protein [Salininema proteolyticum]|uniref:Extensin-like C-terminal domain-containing protein n=1 Tax=Salininema proteolyticum TaxID=1607685 RepID=A0ABV8U3Y4_9ACTN
MTHGRVEDAWGSGECAGEEIERDHVSDSVPLRHRLAWDGMLGEHGGRHSERFHPEAWRQLSRTARDLDRLGREFHPSGEERPLEWIGDIGVKHCKPGWHRFGLAFDLSRVSWKGTYCDMNAHWRDGADRSDRLRYLAVLCLCRCHFGVVLHGRNDPDGSHANHVHLDRSRHANRLSEGHLSDQTLVHMAANEYLGADLIVGGGWGEGTERSYRTMLDRLGLADRGLEPREGGDRFRVMLRLLARTAFQGAELGDHRV